MNLCAKIALTRVHAFVLVPISCRGERAYFVGDREDRLAARPLLFAQEKRCPLLTLFRCPSEDRLNGRPVHSQFRLQPLQRSGAACPPSAAQCRNLPLHCVSIVLKIFLVPATLGGRTVEQQL